MMSVYLCLVLSVIASSLDSVIPLRLACFYQKRCTLPISPTTRILLWNIKTSTLVLQSTSHSIHRSRLMSADNIKGYMYVGRCQGRLRRLHRQGATCQNPVTARKNHKFSSCDLSLEPRSTYLSSFGVLSVRSSVV